MSIRTVILGCSGYSLSQEEKDFFKRCQPIGFILFTRNCHDPDQLKELIQSLKSCVNHTTVPILIDQEGGRVARLTPPHWQSIRPAYAFAKLARQDLKAAIEATFNQGYITGMELSELGINVNCAPCVDLYFDDADKIIGDRSYGHDIGVVVELARSYMKGLSAAGVLPVIKHLPGHGRALLDSHLHLPTVEASAEDLFESDFLAFKRVCDLSDMPFWGMSAHIIYSAFDARFAATHSASIIQHIIRRFIGFKGVLLSDCLTMKALKGTYAQRASQALSAGCDIVLHCSGILDEMLEVMEGVGTARPELLRHINQSLKYTHLQKEDLDLKDIQERLEMIFLEYEQHKLKRAIS